MQRFAGLHRLYQAMSLQSEGGAPAQPMEGWYWMQHPMVRERVNELISGDRFTDGIGRLAAFLQETGRAGVMGCCASIGSGTGGLERDLVQRGMVGEIVGYEWSGHAILEARRLAAERGYGNIRYQLSEGGRLRLPEGRFDAIFSHGFLQHTDALESLLTEVRQALKPGGIFHVDEFVGPSRFQWPDLQVQLINEYLQTLPDRLLVTPTGRKLPVERPTVSHMLEAHPARAVRSGEMREVLSQYFDILEERPYGGMLLHMGLADIAQNFDAGNPEDAEHLRRFFDIEDRELTRGPLPSDFTVITAAAPASGAAARRGARGRPVVFGMSPTRQLRAPAEFSRPGLDLTVSHADTMLEASDAHYLSVGQSAVAAIERALGGTEPKTILDLPCGFGRVTRALRARFPRAAITVSDLDRPGADFSARQFDARAAYSVRDFRELDLGETYDVIWVGSLMTHLPAMQTRFLLAALGRHLSPDGVALVTLHGPSLVPRLREIGYGLSREGAAAVIAEFERTGFGYRDYEGGAHLYGVSLTNDNYGISLTSASWMQANLKDLCLRLQDYEVRAWDDHHDIAVIRRGDG